jgi:predicted nucleic acid-binding protein
VIYLDTSYIVKCYLVENGTAEVRELLADSGDVVSCVHARIEFLTAVHRQFRESQMTSSELNAIIDVFERDCSNGIWKWLELNEPIMALTAKTLRSLPSNVYIRAGDAMHLACAAANGMTEVFSNDRHLLNAAEYFGVRGTNVIPAV